MLRPILAEAAPEQTAWLCRGDLEGPLPPRTGGVPEGQGLLERRALQLLSEWGGGFLSQTPTLEAPNNFLI